MSEDNKTSAAGTTGSDDSTDSNDQAEQGTDPNGPKFEQGPDPLAGVKKGAADVMSSMEGKTVSMKTYVGTIIGIVILMLLARCG